MSFLLPVPTLITNILPGPVENGDGDGDIQLDRSFTASGAPALLVRGRL